MTTQRERRMRLDKILQILLEKKGEARFNAIFSLMFQKYSLSKKMLWNYLEALKTAGKIDFELLSIAKRDEVIIKLVEKCPNCGGELESGKVLCPRTLSWQGREYYYPVGQKIVPPRHRGILRLQGWRCEKCRLVIFLYDKK